MPDQSALGELARAGTARTERPEHAQAGRHREHAPVRQLLDAERESYRRERSVTHIDMNHPSAPPTTKQRLSDWRTRRERRAERHTTAPLRGGARAAIHVGSDEQHQRRG